MSDISFVVPGVPVGKGRPKFARRGNFVTAYTPEKTASYENLVKIYAAEAMRGRRLLDKPVVVNLIATFDVPTSWSKKKRIEALTGNLYPAGRYDIDNIAKGVFDACNGILWVDDKQVVECHLYKRYGEKPFASITVEEKS